MSGYAICYVYVTRNERFTYLLTYDHDNDHKGEERKMERRRNETEQKEQEEEEAIWTCWLSVADVDWLSLSDVMSSFHPFSCLLPGAAGDVFGLPFRVFLEAWPPPVDVPDSARVRLAAGVDVRLSAVELAPDVGLTGTRYPSSTNPEGLNSRS